MTKYLLFVLLLLFNNCNKDNDTKFPYLTVLEASLQDGLLTISLNDTSSLQLNVFTSPASATNQGFIFERKGSNVFEINSTGLIKATKIGSDTLYIKAKADQNIKMFYRVKVVSH